MSTEKINEVKVELKSIEALFATPEADPFDPETRYISGIDELVQQLNTMKLHKHKTRVIIKLPAQAIQPGQKEKIQAAIARYSDVQITDSAREIDQLRKRGKFSLISAIIIIIVAVSLVAFISWLNILNETLDNFLITGVGVFGWVAFWEPFNIYLYYWRTPTRTRRLFKRLKDAELIIEADK